ncbi:hypothetical protein RJ639_001130 [Escallonia herrerae]|uniref:Uncharacterized protein n=1 Tax=Escallonia herrerae TaxID=1293975 RepID=A0AA89BN70_9ASTE|nr:hypothetical protein RJ639_001130 [Escallonia herrerae]
MAAAAAIRRSLLRTTTLAEIRTTTLRSDSRSTIPFDEFGFTHTGQLDPNVTKFHISTPGRRPETRSLPIRILPLHPGLLAPRDYTVYTDRFDWDGVVVFEAVLAWEGEEGSDDCDTVASRSKCRADGKAAVNLMKLTLFRQYYVVVICYIYFTRVVVYALETTTSYRYEWTSVVAGELATLAFYVFTGYNFRPKTHNPYFAIDDEEEEAAAEALKLEDEVEL